MQIMLPLAKLVFQHTLEVPDQITKYCQLMNRPCTASEAVNSSQLLSFLLKKTPNPQNILFPFILNKNMFSNFKGQILYFLPNSWHRSPPGNSTENNSSSQWWQQSPCPPTMGHSVLQWQICTRTYILSTALPKATQGISTPNAAPPTPLSCLPEED